MEQIDAETSLQALQLALGSRHPDIRLEAVRRLTKLRQASPLVPRLLSERLNDSDEKVREAALDSLLALEPDAGVALRGTFERGSPDIRRAVFDRLGRRNLGTTPRSPSTSGQALNSESHEVRQAALWVAVAAHPALAARLHTSGGYITKVLDELRARGVGEESAATPAL